MIICQHNLQFNDLPILSLPWQYCPFTTIPIHNIWTSEDIHGKKCEHFGRFSNKVSSSRSPEVNRPTRLSLLIDIGISVLIVYISQPKYQRDIEHRCARSPRPPPSSPPEPLAHRSSFACPEVRALGCFQDLVWLQVPLVHFILAYIPVFWTKSKVLTFSQGCTPYYLVNAFQEIICRNF